MNRKAFKVLIVEDDPNMREALANMLTHSGYETVVAQEGQEALNILQKIEVDLVISDFRMPGMNGVDLHFSMQERGMKQPFILCTGSPELIPEEALPRLQLHAMLTKPYVIATLEEHIEKLSSSKAGAATDSQKGRE